MNELDVLKVVLQALTVLAAAVGLGLTVHQLRLLRRSYIDLHEWNRRKAAQDALAPYARAADDTVLLDDAFKIMTSTDPIPLEHILTVCKDAKIRAALHRRLNYFESLARGIQHRVFDEPIVRSALEHVFARTLRQFRPYIEHRRESGSTGVWVDFQRVVSQWEERPNEPPRPRTG